jgi:hypothetical protein
MVLVSLCVFVYGGYCFGSCGPIKAREIGSGGYLTRENCDFVLNDRVGIAFSGVSLFLRLCRFENGHNETVRGMAVRVTGNASVVIANCTFRHISAGTGAVFVESSYAVDARLSDCLVEGVRSVEYGAVCCITFHEAAPFGASLVFHRCQFVKNQCDKGGAVACMVPSLSVRDCMFKDCVAVLDGGIIWCRDSKGQKSTLVSITGCSCKNEGSLGTGTAFYISHATLRSLTIEQCSFKSNGKGTGRGYLVADHGILASFSNCKFFLPFFQGAVATLKTNRVSISAESRFESSFGSGCLGLSIVSNDVSIENTEFSSLKKGVQVGLGNMNLRVQQSVFSNCEESAIFVAGVAKGSFNECRFNEDRVTNAHAFLYFAGAESAFDFCGCCINRKSPGTTGIYLGGDKIGIRFVGRNCLEWPELPDFLEGPGVSGGIIEFAENPLFGCISCEEGLKHAAPPIAAASS